MGVRSLLALLGLIGSTNGVAATPAEQCQIDSYRQSPGNWVRTGNRIGPGGALTPINWHTKVSWAESKMTMEITNAETGNQATATVDLTPGAFRLNDEPFEVVRCKREPDGGYLMEILIRRGDQEVRVVQLGYPDRLWYGHQGTRKAGSDDQFRPILAFFETKTH